MATLTLMFSANASANKGATESCTDKCPNGEPRNSYGQCWVCPGLDKNTVKANTQRIKAEAQALKSCGKAATIKTNGKLRPGSFKDFTKAEFQVRAAAWKALIVARNVENNCWDPKDPNHVKEEKTHQITADHCQAGADQATK